MDSLKLECALLSAGGQRRGKAAALALGGGGTVVGARGGSGDCVDHIPLNLIPLRAILALSNTVRYSIQHPCRSTSHNNIILM